MAARTRNVPTLRGQWLGARLRELRESAGLTFADVAEYLGDRHPTTVSRYETGILPIRWSEVDALLTLFRVSDPGQRAEIIALAKDAWRKGWWDEFGDAVDSRNFLDLAWLEGQAQGICWFALGYVPGLLQTTGYMQALFREEPERDEAWVERSTEYRLARQNRLEQADRPRCTLILHENVLHQCVGGAQTMSEQWRHLLELGRIGVLTIRVLPFEAPAYRALSGDFTLFSLPEPFPPVAYVESLAGSLYLESPHVERFLRTYDDFDAAALPVEQSVVRIEQAIEGATDDHRPGQSPVA
jgi:transcriptional regulator with XRE-family HTH domain